MHILTGQKGPQVGANRMVDGVLLPVHAFRTIAEMITGGVLEKHPKLKVISVENDIGWMPNYLKRLEWYSYRFGPQYPQLKMNAADYWRRQVYATFQDDVPGHPLPRHDRRRPPDVGLGLPALRLDVSQVARSDRAQLRDVPEDEQRKILGGNMVEVYNLQRIFGAVAGVTDGLRRAGSAAPIANQSPPGRRP